MTPQSPRLPLRRALAALAVLPLLAGVAACGQDGSSDGTTPKASPCGALPTADPAAALPEGVPGADGQVLYQPSTQGKTVIVFGLVAQDGFVEVRDGLVEQLKKAGWTIDGTDQESVEAEAQFSQKDPFRTGTIKVQPLCTGYVSVRYKLNQ